MVVERAGEVGQVEVGWLRRRLPWTACRDRIGVGGRMGVDARSQCGGDGGLSRGRAKRRGLGAVRDMSSSGSGDPSGEWVERYMWRSP